MQLGEHLIKTWSITQAVIALSSGEAEYYGIVRGASIAMGMRSIMRDFGVDLPITILTDASAAKGIASRRGLGKVRHIEVNQLWVQERVSAGDITIKKISTKDNLADALTRYVEAEILHRHIRGTNQAIVSGRHNIMPESEVNSIHAKSSNHSIYQSH